MNCLSFTSLQTKKDCKDSSVDFFLGYCGGGDTQGRKGYGYKSTKSWSFMNVLITRVKNMVL